MHPLLIAVALCFGACAGPLLVRAAYRLSVPPGEPWRRACPAGHPLAPHPKGWLGPGRCADCAAAIGGPGPTADDGANDAAVGGPGYGTSPLRLAAVTAACCAALAAAVGARPELVVWLLAVPVVVLLATVDLAVQRLPDVLTLPLALGVVAGLGIASLFDAADGDLGRALLGGAVLSGVYFVLFLINPLGMGFGDVKLAITIGVALGWYGWDALVLGTFVGFLLAAGYGGALVIARRAGRGTTVAFGPFMAAGALAALIVAGLAS
ncbi:prepilin peptidase [Streptomyces radicis]|uniref:Prepilin peptidase n=1 Tax=Streptomyces radicis TaxID=1750517 RepID=A0A3A9W377_9ACTN|nr:A24 family peptidase [Streptomyces radicis]RKN07638.1 prepilin peptidase [Streptomyces radicis]RKN18361.1 prepilin peptidase [Streptomyces radicis]